MTESTNLDIGTSFAYGHNDASPDSTTQVFGIDATFRYRPLRRAIYRRFMGRTELFWSRREEPSLDNVKAFGAYVSGDYQFARRWFAGGRYDFSDRATDATLRDKSGSVLLTLLAQRVQPDPHAVPAHALRRGRARERAAVPVPVFHRRARRARVLTRLSS